MCPRPVALVLPERRSNMRGRPRQVAGNNEQSAETPPHLYTQQQQPLTRELMMQLLHTRRFPSELHRVEAEQRIEAMAAALATHNRQDLLRRAFDREVIRWQDDDALIAVHLPQDARLEMQRALYKYARNLETLAGCRKREGGLLIVLVLLAAGLIAAVTIAILFAHDRCHRE